MTKPGPAKSPRKRAVTGAPEAVSPAHDHLVRALELFSGRHYRESLAVLIDAARLHPGVAAVHENLGVVLMRLDRHGEAVAALEHALALGGPTPNLLDALCAASARTGNHAAAARHGEAALKMKDARFGARPPLCTLPRTPPPPFNPRARRENVIAYCIWGTQSRYHMPLRETLKIAPHLFPDWTVRVYHDAALPETHLAPLRRAGADLHAVRPATGEPVHRRLLWRFDVCSDPGVKRFLVRDADAILSVKERVAVDAWLASDRYFHAMRDYFTHTDLLLAGMWGGVGGILPDTGAMLRSFRPFRLEGDHVDQDLLTDRVWPTVRGSCLIHDSVFAGCLGSVPFPPFGALPPGHHVGQNAFIHFRQRR